MTSTTNNSNELYVIGALCTKSRGRDAGLYCVIIDLPKEGYALIDGQTRRRVVNVAHLTPTGKTLDVKKGASHDDVAVVLKKEKMETRATKPKQPTQKPTKQRRTTKSDTGKVATKPAKKKEKPVKPAAVPAAAPAAATE